MVGDIMHNSNFEYWVEYYRVVATLHITAEGLFRELPDNLKEGSYEVEVVYRICFVDNAGRIKIQDFNNPPTKDKTKALGGLVTLDGVPWFDENPNEGTFKLDCKKRIVDASILPKGLSDKAARMHEIAYREERVKPYL